MARKLVLFATALATVALAAPAIAAAAPSLTQPAGVLVKVGTPITITSEKWTLTTREFKNFTCAPAKQEGVVATNNGSSVLLPAKGTGTATGCLHNGGPVTIKEVNLNEVTMKEAGKGTAALFIKIPLFPEGESSCVWSATAVPFTYAAGTSVIVFKEVTLNPAPKVCGPATLDAEYRLTTSTGSPIID